MPRTTMRETLQYSFKSLVVEETYSLKSRSVVKNLSAAKFPSEPTIPSNASSNWILYTKFQKLSFTEKR